jgi:hypothetical protein
MSTNLELINRALREINVIAENENASSEQGSQCLVKLNNMMEIWKEIGIDLGWFKQTATSGTAPIPDYAEMAVVSSLAILCAPQYGASVSLELAGVADRTYRQLLGKAQREALDNVDMTHMPSGSGKYRTGKVYDIYSDG